MEVDYSKNYLDAREIVAQELIEAYGFVESYRDDERLTLDSTNYSFHLTFYVPEGDKLYVSKKSTDGLGKSFQGLVYEKYPDPAHSKIVLKEIFTGLSHLTENESFTEFAIKESFLIKIKFLYERYPHFFYF